MLIYSAKTISLSYLQPLFSQATVLLSFSDPELVYETTMEALRCETIKYFF